jgi:hypothetical protein
MVVTSSQLVNEFSFQAVNVLRASNLVRLVITFDFMADPCVLVSSVRVAQAEPDCPYASC